MQFKPWSSQLEEWTTVRRSGDVSRRFHDVYVNQGTSGAIGYVNLQLNNLRGVIVNTIRRKIIIDYPYIEGVLIYDL